MGISCVSAHLDIVNTFSTTVEPHLLIRFTTFKVLWKGNTFLCGPNLNLKFKQFIYGLYVRLK